MFGLSPDADKRLISQDEYDTGTEEGQEEYIENSERNTETRTEESFEKITHSESKTSGTNENKKKQEGYIENSEQNIKNPVAETAKVDTSEISSIVIINGNTGERKTLTAETSAYKDLLKLYGQLNFTEEYEENTRVGYQYSMKIQDADGNKLQSVTPYKDGLIVDRIFYKYDNTGEAAWASLMLMEYLESVFE